MNDTPALEIKDFRKVYRSKTVAVDNVSLTVPRGQFFGLLGPNGAGKSTTIHCITGVAQPTGGTVKVFGKDVVTEYREARQKVGLAPQEFNTDLFDTPRKILDYIAGYYGLNKEKRRARVADVLTQFRLEEHAGKQFKDLSGGLKRRVMLARAVLHDPELVIFDEPTAGVDVELRRDLWKYMRELNEAGKTIILTSHYLEEVEQLCERIAIINKGKIVADDSKEAFTRDGRLEDRYLQITEGTSA